MNTGLTQLGAPPPVASVRYENMRVHTPNRTYTRCKHAQAWLEPYNDGSLPNARIRSMVLRTCKLLPIDTAREDMKSQLKKSQVGYGRDGMSSLSSSLCQGLGGSWVRVHAGMNSLSSLLQGVDFRWVTGVKAWSHG